MSTALYLISYHITKYFLYPQHWILSRQHGWLNEKTANNCSLLQKGSTHKIKLRYEECCNHTLLDNNVLNYYINYYSQTLTLHKLQWYTFDLKLIQEILVMKTDCAWKFSLFYNVKQKCISVKLNCDFWQSVKAVEQNKQFLWWNNVKGIQISYNNNNNIKQHVKQKCVSDLCVRWCTRCVFSDTGRLLVSSVSWNQACYMYESQVLMKIWSLS